MPLLEFVYQSLTSFRQAFARHRTFEVFCLVLLGFLGTSEMLGISSLCRFWQMDEAGYHRLLHFFHSTAWCAASLAACWQDFVVAHSVAAKVSGRAVLLGDHTHAPKEGVRMPGVVSLRQNSETSSKPSYFRGHHWGMVCLLAGAVGRRLCIPLGAAIHQGFAHLHQEQHDEAKKETLATRLISMALSFAVSRDLPCFLVLDAFFSVASVFELADSLWSTRLKQPYLYIITRAKRSYVAFHKVSKPTTPTRGRPRKYGEKLKLWEVFQTHRDKFKKGLCRVYGRTEVISYYSMNLLWMPLKRELRFIFAITSRGPIILMSNSLYIHATTAVSLYCARTRIETMFWVFKHLLGGFCYRFWSKALPRHSRKPKKNAHLLRPAQEGLASVAACWEAYERFVLIALMALGFLQLIALKFPLDVWERFTSFLRTRSRWLPSERTVKAVVARELLADFHNVAPSATMRKISSLVGPPPEPIQNDSAVA